jgi:hypothetical protein
MKHLLLMLLFMAGMHAAKAQEPQKLADFQLRLQPNPASRYVEVHFVVPAGIASVELFNVLGQKVKPAMMVNTSGGETFLPVDLFGLPHGVYLVRVQHGNQSAIRRLTVQ